jgi:Spy/CpxP family protein refolding chaperone
MDLSKTSKRSRRVALGLALAAAAALPAVALAKGGGPGGCGGGGHRGGPGMGGPSVERLERRVERLDLEAKSQAAVYAILDQARSEQRARRSELRTAHEKMRALLEQDSPDLAAVEAQSDAIGALQTAAHKASLRTLISLRPHLTKEQWAELQPPKRRGGPDDDDLPGRPS